MRAHLIETARPVMEAMVEVVSLHHDISTTTAEEVVLFSLAEPAPVREPKTSKASELGKQLRRNR
jgi:hypothetical protein